MKDDQMDEMLIEGARDYNEPGTVPREEMWARIIEARRGALSPAAPRSTPRSTRRGWIWLAAGVAATAVLSVGVVIGRQLERTAPRSPTVAEVPPTAIRTPSATSPDTTVVRQLHEETNKTGQRVTELAATEPARGDARTEATAAIRSRTEPTLAYRLVVLQHLAGSEAMIAAFRTSARRGEVDAQIAAWARDLLSTTRLLEASPVKEDPTMRRLLEDLDLVLMQISQYVIRGTVNQDDLDLIDESISKRGVINKLRSTFPARTTLAGT